MRPLFFLIWLYPLLELWLLIKVGSAIGTVAVLALILGSGLCGLAILRRAGWLALIRARSGFGGPGGAAMVLTDGVLLAAAGLLLFLPGLLGDLLGLLLLFPSTRNRLGRRFFGAFNRARGAAPRHQPDVIEGDFTREDHEPRAKIREEHRKI